MDLVDNNRLIDVFMESKGISIPVYDQNGNKLSDDYKPKSYHYDWNLLMGVVEKIESLGYKVIISNNNVIIAGDMANKEFKHITSVSENTKREAVFYAIVSFIEWYVKQE